MVVAAIENFVFVNTLLALPSFACVLAVRRMAERGRVHPHRVSTLYAAAIALPPLAAAWLIAAALLPLSWLGETAFNAAHSAPFHQVHLLGDLTATLEPLLAFAALFFAVAASSFAVCSSVRSYLRVGGVISRLEMDSAAPPAEHLELVERLAAQRGLEVGLVMSDYPFSFVWGFGRSRLVLSSGLLRALSSQELAGVLEHEAAHHARRDNLAKLMLSLLSYTSLAFPLSRLLLRWRAEQIELVCDEIAAAYTAAPLEIADALVKLRRQTLASRAYGSAGAFGSSFVPDDAISFERRVRRIVALADALPAPARACTMSQPNRAGAAVVAAIFIATLVSVVLVAPLAVHRIAESLIQYLR